MRNKKNEEDKGLEMMLQIKIMKIHWYQYCESIIKNYVLTISIQLAVCTLCSSLLSRDLMVHYSADRNKD